MVGQTVGKYRVVSRLGRGGMGTVYKAVDETLGREVAIKRLNQDLTEHEVLKRFRAEAITLARLNHPNIATLFELTELDGELLMVMEFVRGETFEGLCERLGAIPIPRAVELCSQVFDALAHAHRAGIVHRDLKPANLMLAESGVVKVMDFGLARMAGAEHLTNDGYMVGTPAYMSPEQVLGGEVDGRADLYAMGVVLYRLLSGQLPFKARSGIEMAHKQMYDPPTPVRQLRTELPDACEAILLRALAKVPDDRYQTADEFRAALAPLAAEAISASRSLSGYASADLARTVAMPVPGPAPSPSSGAASASLDSDMETRLMSGLSPAMLETALSPLPAGADAGAEPAAAAASVADATVAEAAVADAAAGVAESGPATSQGAAAPVAVPVPAARRPRPKGAGTVLATAIAALLLLAIPLTMMYTRSRRSAEALAEVAAPPPPPVAAAPAPAPVSVEASAAPATVPPPDAGAPTAAAAPAPPPAKPNTAASPKSTAAANAAKAAKTTPPPAPAPEVPVEAPPPDPPPAPSIPSVTFPKMKVLLVDGAKTRDRDAALRFDSEELHVMDGHTPIKSAAYRDVIAVYQSHSREPLWTSPDGTSIAVAKTGGKFSFFKGVPDWITVRTKDGFIPLRVDDSDLRHLIAELEARTGTKVVKTK